MFIDGQAAVDPAPLTAGERCAVSILRLQLLQSVCVLLVAARSLAQEILLIRILPQFKFKIQTLSFDEPWLWISLDSKTASDQQYKFT